MAQMRKTGKHGYRNSRCYCFIVDGKVGLHPSDYEVAQMLRKI